MAFGGMETLGLNSLSFDSNLAVRIGAAALRVLRRSGITSQQVADSIGQTLCLTTRVRAEAATVQSSLRCGRCQILLRECELALKCGCRLTRRLYAAANPE